MEDVNLGVLKYQKRGKGAFQAEEQEEEVCAKSQEAVNSSWKKIGRIREQVKVVRAGSVTQSVVEHLLSFKPQYHISQS